jgi:hypothetical protein
MFEPVELSDLLDEMDEQGVQKAILMDNLARPVYYRPQIR